MKPIAIASMLVLTTAACSAETEAPVATDQDVKVEVEMDASETETLASRCRFFLYKCMAQPNPMDAYCLSWMENC